MHTVYVYTRFMLKSKFNISFIHIVSHCFIVQYQQSGALMFGESFDKLSIERNIYN